MRCSPVVWLGLMLVQFSVQRPVWWIYYPLIALPLTWIACLPFSQFLSQLREARLNSIKKLQFFLPMILLIFWLLPIGQAYLRYFKEDAVLIANFRSNPTVLPQQELLDSVLQFSKNNKWILTDDAMYAVQSQTPIPPEVAVMSAKRLLAEQLKDEFFIEIISRYRPEQIVWVRFTDLLKRPALQQALQREGYQSVPTPNSSMLHYVRADILTKKQ